MFRLLDQKALLPLLTFFVGLFFLAATAYAALAVRQEHQQGSGSSLVVDGLELGRISVSPEFIHKFTVYNAARYPLDIVKFETSCGCSQVVPPSLQLAAGEAAELAIKINPLMFWRRNLQQTEGPFDLQIRPLIAGGFPRPTVWSFQGTVVAPCTLDANSVCFAGADAIRQGVKAKTKQIHGKLTIPGSQIKVIQENAPVATRVTVAIENGGDEGDFSLVIAPNPADELGWFETPFQLQITDPTGQGRGVMQFKVSGDVVPAFAISPRPAILLSWFSVKWTLRLWSLVNSNRLPAKNFAASCREGLALSGQSRSCFAMELVRSGLEVAAKVFLGIQ